MRSISKKGQIGALAPAMLALVLAAVLLVFGIIMMQETRDTNIISGQASETTSNETTTSIVNETGVVLVRSTEACGFNGLAIVSVTNENDTATINSGNYTSTENSIACSSCLKFNNTLWNVTYSFAHGEETCESANATIVAFGTFGEFWEIIVLAIVLSIVIGLLLVMFGRRGAR